VQLQREERKKTKKKKKKKKIFGWKVIYKTPQWKTKTKKRERVEFEQKRNGWSWMRDSCCWAHDVERTTNDITKLRTKKSLSFFVGWDFTHI
jgi:hypothetical protein